jgi:hydrogenase maturation protease
MSDAHTESFMDIDIKENAVLVLGVGNILLKDEGVGVKVIEIMREKYDFGDDVFFYDGATAGLDLMPVMNQYRKIIIVDTVNAGDPPGSIYRFCISDINAKVPYKTSLHQIGMVEVFAISEAMGRKMDGIIIGVQPEDMSSWGLELTATIEAKIPEIIERVLGELKALGYEPRNAPEKV